MMITVDHKMNLFVILQFGGITIFWFALNLVFAIILPSTSDTSQ